MNRTEYLLTKLAEECVEVAQRATKALCFGIHEIQPGQPFNNIERLHGEMKQLATIARMLRDEGIFIDFDVSEGVYGPLRAKVEKFMQYSRECGTLRDDVCSLSNREHASAPDSAPMAAQPAVPANSCESAADGMCGADKGQPILSADIPTAQQLGLSLLLRNEPRVSIAMVQRRLGLSYSLASHALQALQRAGYVSTEPSEGWVNMRDVLKKP